MPDLFVYLLKINVALLLFLLGYYALLRPLTFYALNRYYLLFGLGFSTLFPLVDVSALLDRQPQLGTPLATIIPAFDQNLRVQQEAPVDYWFWLSLLFWTGVIFMALRFVFQLVSLYRLHKNAVYRSMHGYRFKEVNGPLNPFSFWKTIYLNPQQHKYNELKQILEHEQVHIKERHTVDVLLAELSTVFYWLNPGIWLYKRAVKENLEFITDRKLMQNGVDTRAYQYNLVNISKLSQGCAMANNFNLLTLKKRIIMMNRKQSSKLQAGRYVFILPLVVALSFAFTTGNEPAAPVASQLVAAPAKSEPEVQVVEQETSFLTASLFYLDGKKSTRAVLDSYNDPERYKLIENIKVYNDKEAVRQFGKKAAGGVVVVTTKKNKNSRAVKRFEKKHGISQSSMVINAPKNGKSAIKKPAANTKSVQDTAVKTSSPAASLYFIDGKKADKRMVDGIPPKTIESVKVYKGNDAKSRFGNKAANGVIIITTIKSKDSRAVKKFEKKYRLTGNDKTSGLSPANAKPVSAKPVARVKPVLTPKPVTSVTAVPKPAAKAKPAITPKPAAKAVERVKPVKAKSPEPAKPALDTASKNNTVNEKAGVNEQPGTNGKKASEVRTGDKSLNPLYIVDGKVFTNFEKLNTTKIASLEVLKDREATRRYGDEAKYGVVIVKLKEH